MSTRTYIDWFAAKLMIEEGKQNNRNPTAWDVTSEAAKESFRQKGREQVSTMAKRTVTDAELEMLFKLNPTCQDDKRRWDEHEDALAAERANHNPTAYFIHVEG